ncbi:PDZ domain-containing protein, partial [Escherichia coli]|nr:PDZ domain-containing protein [Escherichia coli]
AAVLGAPAAGTPAFAAGVQAGDRILAIDGAQVGTWGDARWMLLKSLTDKARPAVEVPTASGERRVRTVDFSRAALGQMEGDV